jgi:hypothetical protein
MSICILGVLAAGSLMLSVTLFTATGTVFAAGPPTIHVPAELPGCCRRIGLRPGSPARPRVTTAAAASPSTCHISERVEPRQHVLVRA